MKCITKKCYHRAFSNRKQWCALNCGVISFWNLKFLTPAGSIQLWILWASIQNGLGTALAGCNEYFDTVCWMKLVTAAGDKPLRRAKLTFLSLNLIHSTHANVWSRIYSSPVWPPSSVSACAVLGTNSKHLLTYSMVQSPSWEANWFAASQEIPRISRNPEVLYRTHKRPPPVSILGQPNPVRKPTSHLLEIHPNIIHPCTPSSPQWSLSFRFPQQDPIHPFSSSIRATCPAHLILLDFITRTILSEEYKSFSLNHHVRNIIHLLVRSSDVNS